VENNKKSKFNFQYKNFKNIKYIGEKNPNLKSTIIWEKGKRSKSLNSLKILNIITSLESLLAILLSQDKLEIFIGVIIPSVP